MKRVRPTLRERLRNKEALVGTFVLIPRLEIVESLAHAGFDFVILDCEHGPFTVQELPTLIAGANGVGIHAIVRVASASETAIGSALDAGADGVLVPHVSDPASAAAVVTWSRFAPEGERSFNPHVRAARYHADENYLTSANKEIAVIVMIEGEGGLASRSAITAVPGIDGVFIGPVDLSASLGVPGQPEHPIVQANIRMIFDELTLAGVASGVYAPTPEAAIRWQGVNAQMIALATDSAMAIEGFRSFARRLAPPRGTGMDTPR